MTRKTLFLLGLLLSGILLLGHNLVVNKGLSFTVVDFLQYWSSSRILIAGNNPYDLDLIRTVESDARPFIREEFRPIISWNPPLIFPFTLLFGYLEFDTAQIIWLIFLCSIIVLSVKTEMQISEGKITWGWLTLILITFYPLYSGLNLGQISAVLLLSLVLFLKYFKKERFFLAGAFLSISLIKPHLLYLIYLWLFFHKDRKQLLLGLTSGAVALLVPALILRSDIVSLYFSHMSQPPLYWQTPTIGSYLSSITFPDYPWLRFAPTMLVGTIFATNLFLRRTKERATDEIYLLLPISLLTSPYGWIFDQALLLPVLFWFAQKYLNERSLQNQKYFVAAIIANLSMFLPLGEAQHHYVWYPAVFAYLSWKLSLRR